MKSSWTLPATEQATIFFARYAKLVAIFKKGSWCGQLLSGITESILLFSLFYGAFMTLVPQYAKHSAIVAALATAIIIEAAARIGLIYSIRAIVRKRFKGKDLAISVFIIPLTLIFISIGTVLSVYGAGDGVEMIATPPTPHLTAGVDSTANQQAAIIQGEWDQETSRVNTEFAPLITQTEAVNASALRLIDQQLSNLRQRERRENTSYSTRRSQLATQRQATEAQGITALAEIQQRQTRELTSLRHKYQPRIDTIRADQARQGRSIQQQNQAEYNSWKEKLSGYTWFLSALVVAFMLLLIVSITLEEIHRAGAEMEEQVQPGAYYFEDHWFTALTNALSAWVGTHLRYLIARIERTTPQAVEPVEPPLIWVRHQHEIKSKLSHNGSPRKPTTVKPFKWEREQDLIQEDAAGLYCIRTTNRTTHESGTGSTTEIPHQPHSPADNPPPTEEPAPHEPETPAIQDQHRGMSISDLTQRLKQYKKNVGSHRQKALAQQRSTGKVQPRTAAAIQNNESWIRYYQHLIKLARASASKTVPQDA